MKKEYMKPEISVYEYDAPQVLLDGSESLYGDPSDGNELLF